MKSPVWRFLNDLEDSAKQASVLSHKTTKRGSLGGMFHHLLAISAFLQMTKNRPVLSTACSFDFDLMVLPKMSRVLSLAGPGMGL